MCSAPLVMLSFLLPADDGLLLTADCLLKKVGMERTCVGP